MAGNNTNSWSASFDAYRCHASIHMQLWARNYKVIKLTRTASSLKVQNSAAHARVAEWRFCTTCCDVFIKLASQVVTWTVFQFGDKKETIEPFIHTCHCSSSIHGQRDWLHCVKTVNWMLLLQCLSCLDLLHYIYIYIHLYSPFMVEAKW